MSKRITMDIPPTWQFVRQIKRMVEDELKDYPETVRYSAGMVASELVGNAIKYGDKSEKAQPPRFSLDVNGSLVEIAVNNSVKSPEHVSQVQMRLDQMANSANKAEYYMKRLQELLTDTPKVQGSQLGLYRIGYEGDFDLSCSYMDQMLTIKATRGLA